jgi:hypothetical protein
VCVRGGPGSRHSTPSLLTASSRVHISSRSVYREWECNVVNCSRLHSECESVSMPLTKASFFFSPILMLSCWFKWTSASFKQLMSVVYMMKPHPTCFGSDQSSLYIIVELRRKARIRRIPRLIGAGVRIIAGKRTIRGSLRPARVISQPSNFSGPNGKKYAP